MGVSGKDSIQIWDDDTLVAGDPTFQEAIHKRSPSINLTSVIDTSGSIQCWGDDTDDRGNPSGIRYGHFRTKGSPERSCYL